jgi:hypothetical protein
MKPAEIARPLGVFVIVIAVILAGSAVLGAVAGGGGDAPTDGQNIQGQSPGQFQPESVNPDVDPETGEINVDADDGTKKLLIDTQHGNAFDRDDIEPVVEALAEAGHTVDFTPSGTSDSGGFGESGGYNATLQEYDAVLVINPTEGFTEDERAGLGTYLDNDGRVVVLGEPTQTGVSGGGLIASLSTVSFGANDLTTRYGARMGAEALFNVDDSDNDNGFKSIYAEPESTSSLSEGVDTITLENPGYIVRTGESDATVLYNAVDGTRTLETRRNGTYATVVRNDNLVFVSDSDFVDQDEVYDADNEVFVTNLLDFLTSGDKPDDVPETATEGTPGGF